MLLILPACSEDVKVTPSVTLYRWIDVDPDLTGAGNGTGYSSVGTQFTPSVDITIHAIRYVYGSELVIYRQSDASLFWSAPITPPINTPDLTWKQHNLSAPVTVPAGDTYFLGIHTANYYQWLGSIASHMPTGWVDGGVDGTGDFASATQAYPAAQDASWMAMLNPVYSK